MLGAVRNQGLIPHEWNIDLHVASEFLLSAAFQRLAWQHGLIFFDDTGCLRACYCGGASARNHGTSVEIQVCAVPGAGAVSRIYAQDIAPHSSLRF
jgi:hypothetical protein